MREIIFRGKNKYNNEWVFGFYSPRITYPTLEQTPNIKNLTGSDIEINVETLGQYTGLKDKNGNKIFEGDIFKGITEDTNEARYAVVKFGKYKDVNSEDSCYGFYFELNGEQFSLFNGETEGYNLLEMIEIVGNIHDNPELLEVENE